MRARQLPITRANATAVAIWHILDRDTLFGLSDISMVMRSLTGVIPVHLFSLASFAAEASARPRNMESAIFFCASERLL